MAPRQSCLSHGQQATTTAIRWIPTRWEGAITLENGALNVMDLKATATVTVVEAPVEDNTITATYNNKDVTLSVTANRRRSQTCSANSR